MKYMKKKLTHSQVRLVVQSEDDEQDRDRAEENAHAEQKKKCKKTEGQGNTHRRDVEDGKRERPSSASRRKSVEKNLRFAYFPSSESGRRRCSNRMPVSCRSRCRATGSSRNDQLI